MRKKIFSIWSVLLVLVVSIAVLAPGCRDDGVETYDLTVVANPVAGGAATDETDGSPYAANTTVDIKAVAAACCQFVDWTAPAGTFGNTTAAETTFIMPARNVTVTANFVTLPLDHFKGYWVSEGMPILGEPVQLEDQFGTINATVGAPYLFGNPVEKVHGDVTTPISDPDNHLTWYDIYPEKDPQMWTVTVTNQFGNDQLLLVGGPFYLAVPTQKADHGEPECLDHFLVYGVLEGPLQEVPVYLQDQFTEEGVMVYEPAYFANPVKKTHGGEVTDIKNPDDHLVSYWINGGGFFLPELPIVNQFGPQSLNVYQDEMWDILAVPSLKINWVYEGPMPF